MATKEHISGQQALSQLSAQYDKSKDSAKTWQSQIQEGSAASAKAGSAEQKKMEAMKAALDQLGTKYDDVSLGIDNKLTMLDDSHSQKMQSMQESMQGLQDKLAALKSSFQDTMAGITQTEENALGSQADKITALQQKLSDLQDRAQQEKDKYNKKGENIGFVSAQTNTEIERTQAELAKLQASQDTQMAKLTPDQQKTVTDRQGMTAADKTIADAEDRKADATTKESAEETKIKDQITVLDAKKQAEEEAYGAQRTQLINTGITLAAFHGELVNAMNDMASVTKEKLKEMQTDLAQLAKTMTPAEANTLAKERVSQQHTAITLHQAEASAITTKKQADSDAHQAARSEITTTTSTLTTFHDTLIASYDDMAKQTEKSVVSMNAQLIQLQATMSRIAEISKSIPAGTAAETTAVPQTVPTTTSLSPYIHSGYGESNDSSVLQGRAAQADALNQARADQARSQAQAFVHVEIQMGDVHVTDQSDIDKLVNALARKIQLQQLQAS